MMRIREQDAATIRRGILDSRLGKYDLGLIYLLTNSQRKLYRRANQRTTYGINGAVLRASREERAAIRESRDQRFLELQDDYEEAARG